MTRDVQTTQNLDTNSFLPAASQQLTVADLGFEKPTKMSSCATTKYNLALEENLQHLTNPKEESNDKKCIQNEVTSGTIHLLQTNFLLNEVLTDAT